MNTKKTLLRKKSTINRIKQKMLIENFLFHAINITFLNVFTIDILNIVIKIEKIGFRHMILYIYTNFECFLPKEVF